MTIFQNKANGKEYFIEHLVYDMRFLNGGAFTGIYAHPYGWDGKVISHTLGDCRMNFATFNPEKFVEDNFEPIYKAWR